MDRREIRDALEAYMDSGPFERMVVQEMCLLADYDFGALLQAATDPDGFRAMAAVSMLPLYFGEDGFDALEMVAKTTRGFGPIFAQRALDRNRPGYFVTDDDDDYGGDDRRVR